MQPHALKIRSFWGAVLLASLLFGGMPQSASAASSKGKIPVIVSNEFSVNRKFPAIYYIFDFDTEIAGDFAELTYGSCDANVCELSFAHNGKISDLFVVDVNDRDTQWDFHIGFYNFAKSAGAYTSSSQNQFLLRRIYINAKLTKEFGVGYVGIAYCKELEMCKHLESLLKRNTVDLGFYQSELDELAQYRDGNEFHEKVYQQIKSALEVLNSLLDAT